MFSNSTKYAIKAALYLAVNSSQEKKVVVQEMAGPINVPKAYIAKILQELSRRSLISSTRGPKGGFYLNEEQLETKILDIVRAVGDEGRTSSCLLSLEKCNSSRPCPLHHLVYKEKELIVKIFENTSLNDLKDHLNKGKSILPF